MCRRLVKNNFGSCAWLCDGLSSPQTTTLESVTSSACSATPVSEVLSSSCQTKVIDLMTGADSSSTVCSDSDCYDSVANWINSYATSNTANNASCLDYVLEIRNELTMVNGSDCSTTTNEYVEDLYTNGIYAHNCTSFTCCDYFQMGYMYDYYRFTNDSQLGTFGTFMNNVYSTCSNNYYSCAALCSGMSTSSSSSTIIFVGIGIGAVAGVASIGSVVVVCVRYRKRRFTFGGSPQFGETNKY